MNHRKWIVYFGAAALAGGCASNGGNHFSAAANQQAAADARFSASQKNPISAKTRFAAGQLDESEGNVGGAIAQYQDALALDPTCKPALFRLGLVYTAHKRYTLAQAVWERYVRITDGSAASYGNLGFCLQLAGRTTEAANAYQRGIAKDPTNQACRVNYGLMLARDGQLTQAAQQLGQCLTPAQVHYNLASVLQSQGKKPQARHEYDEALKLDPNMVDARTRLAGL